MKDDDLRLTADEAEKLVASVLQRTTGGACRRAEELLSDLAFGDPLLAAHLQHCARCSEMAIALRRAASVLPSLAAFDPGPAFTWEVLNATSRQTHAAGAGRLAAWWRQWLARPRFAFELAYVATLLLVLLVGNPVETVQAASARTATVAARGLDRARTIWPSAVEVVGAEGRPAPGIGRLAAATREVLGEGAALRNNLDSVWGRALQAVSSSSGWLRGAASYLLNGVRTTWSRLRTASLQWIAQDASRHAGRANDRPRAATSEPAATGPR
jgi:hypothetical protein